MEFTGFTTMPNMASGPHTPGLLLVRGSEEQKVTHLTNVCWPNCPPEYNLDFVWISSGEKVTHLKIFWSAFFENSLQ